MDKSFFYYLPLGNFAIYFMALAEFGYKPNNTFAKGRLGEQIAADYLTKKGYIVLATHYQALGAEIDIIAQDGKELVAIEVKSGTDVMENVGELITNEKKRRIERALGVFICKMQLRHAPIRFEILAVALPEGKIEHFREEFFDF